MIRWGVIRGLCSISYKLGVSSLLERLASLLPDYSLPCLQGRVGVGLLELAAMFGLIARLLHPTPTLPYYT
ncbi:hypothetical protein GCM10007898_07570 [Dyella flagellata]|uniref:Uncharacterized protein n=1 Tax=Dyella flagellata TaxID=1867833 RepID=A0ABQ5X6E8_9GAMM|nr:hypothetical protein GCM10007898_07570 [Dyella flagellata]